VTTAAHILVAVDGSPESTAALTWATHEAQVSARELRLVHVADYLPGYGYFWASTVGAPAALQDAAEPIVTGARALVRELAPTVPVRAAAVTGSVVHTLLAECDEAELAVVGSRGAGAFSRLLLGSVSYRLAAHASCPLVVVSEPNPGTAGRTPAAATAVERVVVGVGGAHGTAAVVDFAFTEAGRHGVPLVAIRTWEPPDSPVPFGRNHVVGWDNGPATEYIGRREQYERAQLLKAIASARAAHPRVRVTVRLRTGSAAMRLTRACRPHDLLVIGHRHSGRFYPPALGAVSSAVIHHASCPLAVVPVDAPAQLPVRASAAL
jgi:nucleotide-binding universal stress UspA family protein